MYDAAPTAVVVMRGNLNLTLHLIERLYTAVRMPCLPTARLQRCTPLCGSMSAKHLTWKKSADAVVYKYGRPGSSSHHVCHV